MNVPLELKLAYQKWIEAEAPDYFGGDRDQELRMKSFFKTLDGYSSAETRKTLLKALDEKHGKVPERFRKHFL